MSFSQSFTSNMSLPTPLHYDIFDADKTRSHLQSGVNINSTSISGFGTPLHILIANEKEQRFFDVCKELKKLNIKIDFTLRDGQQKTLLILACKVRRPKIVKHILEMAGSSSKDFIDFCDEDGRAALHYACALGDLVSATLLLDAGADVNLVCKLNKSALDYSTADKEMINSILSAVEIDPDRHFKACYNSLAGLEGGYASILPKEQMSMLGFVASKFKRHATSQFQSVVSNNYQEILICQKNKEAFFHFGKVATSKEFDCIPQSLREEMKVYSKVTLAQWDLIKGEDVSISDVCLKGHSSVNQLICQSLSKSLASHSTISPLNNISIWFEAKDLARSQCVSKFWRSLVPKPNSIKEEKFSKPSESVTLKFP